MCKYYGKFTRKKHILEKEKMNFFILFPSYLKELYLKIICIKRLCKLCKREREREVKKRKNVTPI